MAASWVGSFVSVYLSEIFEIKFNKTDEQQ